MRSRDVYKRVVIVRQRPSEAFLKGNEVSKVQFAQITEQGITFGVVVVKDHVIENRTEANGAVAYWSRWIGWPTILMGAQHQRLYGRRDIVNFMSNVTLDRIPWLEATLAA